MRSVEQHLEAVLADVSPLESLEVGLLGSVGCVLAEQVTAEDDGKEHVLLPQGTAIGARHVALLAAANMGRIWVHPKPRVVILTVGSDLAAPTSMALH
jgi:molybdopterin biosynthesis enzyme